MSAFGTLERIEETPERPKSKSHNKKRRNTTVGMFGGKNKDHNSNQDDEDYQEGNGVLFWVNKSGFPIDYSVWERMWRHVLRINPDGATAINNIRNADRMEQVPIPTPPTHCSPNATAIERINAVQNYMRQLQYNHTGTQLFDIRKNRPISGLMDVARDMLRESLPIKCLEAVILGIYLTNGLPGVERFTIGFKSSFSGGTFHHVVLGILCNGYYGSIGMSRREALMYKPIRYKSLTELVLDYKASYRKYWHELKKVKIGLPVPHNPHSYEQICWKYLNLNMSRLSEADLQKQIEKHAREVRTQGRSNSNPLPSSPHKPKSTPSYTQVLRRETSTQATKTCERPTASVKHTRSSKHENCDTEKYQIRI